MELKVIQGGMEEPKGDYIESVFGEKGALARLIPNYNPRPSQVALSRAIDRAIREEKHVIAEGPTGTGKSFAYSVPAAFHAAFRGKRVCIVTSNKTLQSQIYKKDLKMLQEAVSWPFKFALRKGIKSYLCNRNLEAKDYKKILSEAKRKVKFETKNLEDLKEYLPKDEIERRQDDIRYNERLIEEVHATLAWADTTTDGDSEEIVGMPPSRRVWNAFSTDSDACDGAYCEFSENCFPRAAKQYSEDANIIVTNYWLFYLHVRNSKDGQQSPILPPVDVVIFDEAHNAAEIAMGFWGMDLSIWSIRNALSGLRKIDLNRYAGDAEVLWRKCNDAADRLWLDIEQREKQRDRRIRPRYPIDSKRLEDLMEDAEIIYAGVGRALDPGKDSKDDEAKAQAKKFYKRADKCKDIRSKLTNFRTMPLASENRWKRQVYYVEREEGQKTPKLMSKTLFVGQHLHHKLFKPFSTVVQTSATIAIGGDGDPFSHIKEEMGMMGLDPIELAVESPFRWKEQSLLVIPGQDVMPSLTKVMDIDRKKEPEKRKKAEEDWDSALGPAVEKIVRMVGGRTMVLFTAKSRLRMVRDHLAGVDLPFNVYAQRDSAHNEVKNQFIEDRTSVLLGTKRFSEGIDVQGESCTCVIIDRLPFEQPNDPVMLAIGELRAEEDNVSYSKGGLIAFREYSVPKAIISFKQRLGRLIRTVDDCGVVVVLDDRLETKHYKHRFIRSIPDVRRTRDIDQIVPFLKSVGAL